MPLQFETKYEDQVVTIATARSLLTLVWRATPTVANVATASHALSEVIGRGDRPWVLCALAAPSVAAPDGPTRTALERELKQLDGRCTGAVNIVLARGFVAAAVRGMLTGLNLFVRPQYPTSFVATTVEGASFIAKHWPRGDAPPPSEREVEHALAAIAPG